MTINIVCNHIREVYGNLSQEDISLIQAQTVAAIQFCITNTGMPQTDMDDYPDITIAVLALIADMWDNREYTTTEDKRNPVVDTILGFYPSNLLPTPDDETYTAPPAAVLPTNFMAEVIA